MTAAPAGSSSPQSLEQLLALVRTRRDAVQIRIVELSQVSHFEKIQRARLVTVAVLEFIEAQAALELALVVAIGELRAKAEDATNGA